MRGVEHLEQFCHEQHVPPKAIQGLMLAPKSGEQRRQPCVSA
jgi:hypothetical protein